MVRIPRVVIPDIAHHIVNRGSRRQVVFFCDEDYLYFLEMLALFSRIYEVEIISYCLMTNHFHLIVIPPDAESLSQMMGDVQKLYTRMVNFRQGWRGRLWQGPYFSCPMNEAHTLRTARYIELNPVHAKMVDDFSQYVYSSAKFHMDIGEDPVLKKKYFDFTAPEWASFVNAGMKETTTFIERVQASTKNGWPLGKEAFIEKLEMQTGKVLRKQKSGPKQHSKI